jgi:hypothetical protein
MLPVNTIQEHSRGEIIMKNHTKKIIVALGIVLTASLSTGVLVSAAKPLSAAGKPSTKSVQGSSQGGNCSQSSTNQVKAGSQNTTNVRPTGKGPVPTPSAAPSTDTTDSNAVQAVGTVIISGGYNTDPQDGGRPVVLIAAVLGVQTEVFRDAFSGVTPAGAGSSGPTSEEAQKNKAALMSVLAPYGITNERLDEVSNFYRYSGVKGQVWSRTAATATAIITNGVVTGIKITNPGAGYSSTPTITVMGPNGKITATATVTYTSDFKTNGSISSIVIK